MLDQLAAGGSTVVRLGRASSTELDALVDSFGPAELQILGPSEPQLLTCAEIIAERSSDSAALVADALAADTESSAVSVYRRLTLDLEPLDNYTDGVRPGAAVNLQSIVLSVGPQDQRVLLTLRSKYFSDASSGNDDGLGYELTEDERGGEAGAELAYDADDEEADEDPEADDDEIVQLVPKDSSDPWDRAHRPKSVVFSHKKKHVVGWQG